MIFMWPLDVVRKWRCKVKREGPKNWLLQVQET